MQSNDVRTSFLSGVLDPRAEGRVDTSAYAQGLLEGTNVEMVHLGGIQRRRGLRYEASLPNQLSKITLGAGTYTMPNGGTPATIRDNDEATTTATTTPVGSTDPYVVAQIDLGSASPVLFADVLAMTASGGSSTQFVIQYSNDGSTWQNFGSSLPQVDSSALYTYRRSNASGNNLIQPSAVTARYWRLAKVGGTTMGSAVISLGEFGLWADTGVVSEGRIFSFEVSTTEQYIIVATDHAGMVWSGDTAIDYIYLPYSSDQLSAVDYATTAETMMIVHEGHTPRFVIRQSTTNFQSFRAVFDAVPKLDYADSLSPASASEIQTLTFGAFNTNDKFTLTIQSDTTGPINWAGANSTTANAIAKAVQSLWVVNGFNGVSCTSGGGGTFTLTFAGSSAGPIGVITIANLTHADVTASAVSTQTGVSRQEPVWSSTRGFPRTVTFYQGRMYFGGTKSQQESILGSWVNNILNFSTDQGLDDQAIYTTLNGAALNAINGLFPAKSLCFFTTGGEFRFANDNNSPITPASAPVNQSQYGGAQIKPVMTDGNVLFVQRNKKSIRDFQFDYTQNSFNSLGVSALAPHLIYDVNGMASWNGSSRDEINFVFVINGTNPSTDSDKLPDGTCAVYNSRKEVNVQGWVIWETQGTFKAVGTIVEDIYFLVRRVVGNKSVMMLERADDTLHTDAARTYTYNVASQSAIGMNHLEGLEVRIVADGFVLDKDIVTNGQVQFNVAGQPYSAKNVEIGLFYRPTMTPMPIQTTRYQSGSNSARRRRIVRIRVKVRNTLGLIVNGVPLSTSSMDVSNLDQAQMPYSGVIELADTSGWDQEPDKLVTFTQDDPLPFMILYMDTQLEGAY